MSHTIDREYGLLRADEQDARSSAERQLLEATMTPLSAVGAGMIVWFLDEVAPRALASPGGVCVLGPEDLDTIYYKVFELIAPHGSVALPGSAHYLLQQALSRRLGAAVTIEHVDDLNGDCNVRVRVRAED